DTENTIFVELHPQADRAIAQRDVVRLRPGEILERGSAAVCGDDAKVGLKCSTQQNARLRFAARQYAFDERIRDEIVHQRRRRAGREHVEVSAAVASAPEA